MTFPSCLLYLPATQPHGKAPEVGTIVIFRILTRINSSAKSGRFLIQENAGG